MSKQLKTETPTDADLAGNPMIGGSKGTTRSGTSPDDLAADLGETTIEGDAANDTNRYGGIDKTTGRGGRPADLSDPPRHEKPRS
jgi:hypothetical protein